MCTAEGRLSRSVLVDGPRRRSDQIADWALETLDGVAADLSVQRLRTSARLDAFIFWNSWIPGMCTLYADSAREAPTKVCTLQLLAGENVSSALVSPHVLCSRCLSVPASSG